MNFPGELLVTIVIPTLEAGLVLDFCLQALSRQTLKAFEVTIVNNGIAAIDTLSQPVHFPCRIISAGSNIGFGAAVNLAIRATETPFIVTLNDDTEPDPEWLAALVAEAQTHARIGMCASSIRLFETGRLDSAGMLICFDGNSRQRGHAMPASFFPHSEPVLLPSACAALYRRRMLDEIGLFDEDYFLYCEDTDLGMRARWAGWQCSYAPGATVSHRYSHTAGSFSELKAYYVERNRMWVAIKNFPAIILLMVPLVSCARYFWQLGAILHGKGAASEFFRAGNSSPGVLRIVFRSYVDTLRHLSSLLRKRAAVRRTRKLSSWQFVRLLLRHRISARELARI